MNQPGLAILLTVPLLIVPAGAALAHHGVDAHFDTTVDIQFEAVVTDLKLVNPHSYLYFSRLDGDGTVVDGRCELFERRFLVRYGLSNETLPAGTPVRISGNPARREANVCHVVRIELADGRSFGYRGEVGNDSDYVPGEALARAAAGSGQASSRIIAESSREAVDREAVAVPAEGMFGNWVAFTGMLPDGPPPGVDVSEVPAPMMMGMGAGGDSPPQGFMGARYRVDYTAAGRAFADSYDAAFDSPDIHCRASVLNGMQHHALVNEFVPVDDARLRWVYGYMDLVRTISMDRTEHPDDLEPAVLGHSIGAWDGPVLVVDTRGFQRGELFRGVLNSEQLHLVEWVTHDPESDRLAVSFMAMDPEFWVAPLQGVVRLARSDRGFTPYGCIELSGENNLRDPSLP